MLGKMKELMEMKKNADKIKKELDAISVEVEEIRGIKVVLNGSQKFKSIEIDEALFNENKEKFERNIVRSVNAAIKASQKVAAKKMQSVMPGF